jgi:hypothetical protein
MTPPLVAFCALAVWLGAAVLFTAVVAPAAFAALPTRTLAGDIVGRVLPVVLYAGIGVGALVVALDTVDAEEWRWSAVVVAGAIVAAACAAAQFVVGARIELVRSRISGPVDARPPGDPLRVAFGRLHGVSVALLGVAMLAAAAALIAVGRNLSRR